LAASGVDIGRGQVLQALMIALMVVVADKRIDLCFQVTGQEVVLEQDAVFECLMPTFVSTTIDPLDQSLNASTPLRLRVIGRAACMRHAFVAQIVGQLARDVAWAIIREQARTMHDMTMHDIGLVKSGCL